MKSNLLIKELFILSFVFCINGSVENKLPEANKPAEPANKTVETKNPDLKSPEVKAPEIKAPEIKTPAEVKAPEVKVDIKVDKVLPKEESKPEPVAKQATTPSAQSITLQVDDKKITEELAALEKNIKQDVEKIQQIAKDNQAKMDNIQKGMDSLKKDFEKAIGKLLEFRCPTCRCPNGNKTLKEISKGLKSGEFSFSDPAEDDELESSDEETPEERL